jgi:aminocarboxymuconate-semialdehyde decarboxylase
MVFAPGLLHNLVELAGPEHVLLGTDYPFDMGEGGPQADRGRRVPLPRGRRKHSGGNAVRLFGLD